MPLPCQPRPLLIFPPIVVHSALHLALRQTFNTHAICNFPRTWQFCLVRPQWHSAGHTVMPMPRSTRCDPTCTPVPPRLLLRPLQRCSDLQRARRGHIRRRVHLHQQPGPRVDLAWAVCIVPFRMPPGGPTAPASLPGHQLPVLVRKYTLVDVEIPVPR